MNPWLVLWCVLRIFLSQVIADEQLVPQVKTFQTLQEMKESTFWNHFITTRNPVIANLTAMYVNETGSVYYFEERIQPGLWRTWLGRRPSVSLIEVNVGERYQDLPIRYYPLATVSAMRSTQAAFVEREITHGFAISIGMDLRLRNNLLVVGITTGLSSQYAVGLTLSQSMICRVPRNGTVQMQVSSEIRHFPRARARRVIYIDRTQQFQPGPWEPINSTVNDEQYDGLMFYWLSTRSRQRCVTDRGRFRNITGRWLPREPRLLKYKRELKST